MYDFDTSDPSEEDAEVQEIIDQGQKAYSIVQEMLSKLTTEDKETLKTFLNNVVFNDSIYVPSSDDVIETMRGMLMGES